MTIESNDKMTNESVSKKKIKKFTRKKSSVTKIDKQTSQNVIDLEARRIDIIKLKAKVFTNIKIALINAFDNLTLT